MVKEIQEKFKALRLKHCAQNIESMLEQGRQKNHSALQTIHSLLDLEIEQRRRARIALCFKQSKLPEQPTIDQFDFSFHSSRSKHRATILSLLDLEFIRNKMDVILIGNPGVGQSLLAKTIAYGATQAGIKTLFTSAMDMINQLVAAQDNHTLLNKLKTYQNPDLLVIDEIGYLPLGQQGSNWSGQAHQNVLTKPV
nr:ATP-binding protein [uncultured Desulfobulbus sp.]